MCAIMQISYVPGAVMLPQLREQALNVASEIADVPGLCWKLATRDEAQGISSDLYLFGTEASARAWEKRAKALLARLGAIGMTAQLLSVDEMQSAVTHTAPRIWPTASAAGSIAAADITDVTRFPAAEIIT